MTIGVLIGLVILILSVYFFPASLGDNFKMAANIGASILTGVSGMYPLNIVVTEKRTINNFRNLQNLGQNISSYDNDTQIRIIEAIWEAIRKEKG